MIRTSRLARLAAAASALALGTAARADIIGFEDFDGGALNVSSPLASNRNDAASPAGRMFGVRSRSSLVNGNGLPFAISDDSVVGAAGNTAFPGDTQGIFGRAKTDNFFGEVDFNQVPPDSTSPAVASISFDVAGFTDLSLAIDIGAIGDFEAGTNADVFNFAVSLDGGAFVTLFEFRADEAASLAYRAMDSGATPSFDDPLLLVGSPGVFLNKSDALTGALDTFTGAVAGTGSTLTLRFTRSGQSATAEAFAFDNIVVNGVGPAAVPEPASLALLALGGLGLAARFRKAGARRSAR